MNETVVTAAKWTVDSDGAWVSLRCADVRQAKAAAESLKPDKPYELKLKEYRKKRSKNANDYLWEMCTQLAVRMSMSPVEVYRQHIKEVGIFRDVVLQPDVVATIRHAWEQMGIGWMTEQVDYSRDGNSVIIRCYYGSSTYNTKQMSRLLDSVLQDCRAVGIETAPPQDVALLTEEWGNTA